jgi:hypothetical protein
MTLAVSATATPDAKALERAIAQGITARRTSPRCWMVSASGGRGEDEVIVDGAAMRCYCRAGLHGRACKHAALVQVLDASGAVPVPETGRAPAGSGYAAPLGGEDRQWPVRTAPATTIRADRSLAGS